MRSNFYYLDTDTYKVMTIGLVIACVCNISHVAWVYDENWLWAQGFPLAWLSICMGYMSTFFHELGHAFAGWLYGYVSSPSFDFQYGGGMTYHVTGQLVPLVLLWDAGLCWIIYKLHEYRYWQIFVIAVLAFHLATAYGHIHETVMIFAGPLAEVLVAGFLLFRAWHDLAPRGVGERFLNAVFGFGLMLQVFIEGWGWIHDAYARDIYQNQKEGHGMGDFDRIAADMNWDFSIAIWIWMVLAATIIITQTVRFLIRDYHSSKL